MYDGLFVAAEFERVVNGAYRVIQFRLPDQHRDPDLGGIDDLDVHARCRQRLAELRRHPGVRTHSGAHEGHLAHLVVIDNRAELQIAPQPFELLHRSRPVLPRKGERDVGAAHSVRNVLQHHVDVDLGGRDRAKDPARRTGSVRHVGNRDLGFGPVVSDTGYQGLFHGYLLDRAGDRAARLVAVGRPHTNRHTVPARVLTAAQHQYPRTARGELQHLLVGYGVDLSGVGHDARVGGVDPVDIGVDLAHVGVERSRQCDGRRIGTTPAERGDVLGLPRHTLEPGDECDVSLVDSLAHAARRDVQDPRVPVYRGCRDTRLRTGERPRLGTLRGDRHRDQRVRDPLTRGEQHIHFALGWGRIHLPGHVQQVIGRVAHRRTHHDDIVTSLLGGDDPLSHLLDTVSILQRRATVLLDHERQRPRTSFSTLATQPCPVSVTVPRRRLRFYRAGPASLLLGVDTDTRVARCGP